MDLLVQGIVTGVLIGGLYALMSLGISLSWGALKIINLAHFSFILLSAYLVYQLTVTFEVDPLLMALVVSPVFFVVGVLIQMFFHWTKIDEFKSLIVTFGIFIILQSGMQTIWSADFRRIDSSLNSYAGGSITIAGIPLPFPVLLSFIAAVAIAVAMSLVLGRTYFGKAVRAVAQDPEMARAYGVDTRRVAVLLSGLSGMFSALAGVFIALGQAIFPGLAVSWFGIVFSVVILGGLGNTV
ncbi:MAG TPA: branched-chain amino acid ABC transporter permease, partial [Acidimicrobiia bacterium]